MNVKRYNQEYYHSGDESTLDEAPDGEWVRWADVEPLLAGIKAERNEARTDARRQLKRMTANYIAEQESTIVELRALLREIMATEFEAEGGGWILTPRDVLDTLLVARIEKAVEVEG